MSSETGVWLIAKAFVDATAKPNEIEFITLSSEKNADHWLQLSCDNINTNYPLMEDLQVALNRLSIELPPNVKVSDFDIGVYATFEYAVTGAELELDMLVRFVSLYLQKVLHMPLSEFDYLLREDTLLTIKKPSKLKAWWNKFTQTQSK
jgi:hypothetical protein